MSNANSRRKAPKSIDVDGSQGWARDSGSSYVECVTSHATNFTCSSNLELAQ
jgi:hypothetical protein